MKKIFFFLFFAFAACTTFAQTPSTAPAATPATATVKKVQNPAAWACPQCFHISKDGGTCEKCSVAKVQLGTYYCPKCMKGTGTKAGNCPTCGTATVQMTRKLCASHNGMTKPAATPAKTS
jgi:hypothetical protein